MISTREYLGGGFAQSLTPPQVYIPATEVDPATSDRIPVRWHYLFVSGQTGAATVKFPVSDLMLLGFEYTFVIETDAVATVAFQNGRGIGQAIWDRFGGVRATLSSSTGQFGTQPAVRARLIDNSDGGVWTIWSVGDAD